MYNAVKIFEADGTTYTCQSPSPEALITFLGWYIQSDNGTKVTLGEVSFAPPPIHPPVPQT